MKQNVLSLCFVFLFFSDIFAQQVYPGGVTGAETWYMADFEDLDSNIYHNHGYAHIRITPCEAALDQGLINFNHAIKTEKLCLKYNAPLENTTTRNIFFVGEPRIIDQSDYSHVTTGWNALLGNMPQTSLIIRNRFDLAMKSSYVNSQFAQYSSLSNAHINFYHWNIYQTDRKFKSFGYEGESTFYIGKQFVNSGTQAKYFNGLFPEFISFPFELNANERNRVESYLALKYGITLDLDKSYKSARNKVFWDNSNNNLFGNFIFGIGRDDISGLNQLQSESIHNKDYLIASVEKLALTNPIKQQMVSISNENFIVFGDNSAPDGLEEENDFKVRTLKKKWLSQNTGSEADIIRMFFKLNLAGVIQESLLENPAWKVWMLHDRYVTNQQVSDFNSQYVEYYEPVIMDGIDYSYYENVFFDTDNAVYDQYTFGIGPDMIVQARFDTDNCDDEYFKTYVVITGGEAPYYIEINNTNSYFENFTINENTMAFDAIAPDTYTIYVKDAVGVEAEIELEVIQYQMTVDLGPDQILNASQPQVTLDAGQNISDPDATYQWYHNGVLMSVDDSTITVSQPGEYKVVVTSGNRACEVSDVILINYNFTGSAIPAPFDCGNTSGSFTLNLSGGSGLYTTIIEGPTQTVIQVHEAENIVFNDLEFGLTNVTTTDSNGQVFQELLFFENPLDGMEINITDILEQGGCVFNGSSNPIYTGYTCIQDPFILDASVANPSVTYEWYMNGVPMNINDPVVELVYNQTNPPVINDYNEYQLIITNLESGCSVTQTFGTLKHMQLQSISQNAMYGNSIQNQSADVNDQPEEMSKMTTRVYPNPSDFNTTFYYEISADEVFDGTVQIFTPTGALIKEVTITGQSSYTLPFQLLVSGVYSIRTTTSGTYITDTVIIR